MIPLGVPGLSVRPDLAPPHRGETGSEIALADILFYGIAFVFLGLCLLYVRAADKL